MMKKLIVFACVDFMGDTEEEYAIIKKKAYELFPGYEIEFHPNDDDTKRFDVELVPGNLEEKFYNVYFFDWGGLLPGCDGLMQNTYRALLEQVRKYPQRLFIMWSTFTEQWYKEICEAEFPAFIAPNVIFHQDERLAERCQKFWFGDD